MSVCGPWPALPPQSEAQIPSVPVTSLASLSGGTQTACRASQVGSQEWPVRAARGWVLASYLLGAEQCLEQGAPQGAPTDRPGRVTHLREGLLGCFLLAGGWGGGTCARVHECHM